MAVCSASSKYSWDWYCGQQNVARSLFTAVLPPLLLMLWQSLVMPNVLYRFAWVSHFTCGHKTGNGNFSFSLSSLPFLPSPFCPPAASCYDDCTPPLPPPLRPPRDAFVLSGGFGSTGPLSLCDTARPQNDVHCSSQSETGMLRSANISL